MSAAVSAGRESGGVTPAWLRRMSPGDELAVKRRELTSIEE
ncbi:hypothetical protein [Microbispora rosea]